MDQRGNYRWYEYRDVSTDVIDQAPQLSGKSILHLSSLTDELSKKRKRERE